MAKNGPCKTLSQTLSIRRNPFQRCLDCHIHAFHKQDKKESLLRVDNKQPFKGLSHFSKRYLITVIRTCLTTAQNGTPIKLQQSEIRNENKNTFHNI